MNKTLLNSRLKLNLAGAHGSMSSNIINHDSHGSNAFVSPMSSNDFSMINQRKTDMSNHGSRENFDY